MTAIEKELLNYIERLIISGEISLDFMVKNIELSLEYSNGCSASEYSRRNNITYNGAKTETKTRLVKKIGGIPFCFDNN